MGKIDTKKIKSRLALKDYKKVVEALGISAYMESDEHIIYYSGDKYVDYLCHKPKLYFYKDNKVFMNFTTSCSYDLFGLVQKRLGLLKKPNSFMDAVHFVMNVLGLESVEVERVNENRHVYDWENDFGKFLRHKSKEKVLPEYDKAILDQLAPCYPQAWIDEGISIETMEKYHIGYYERTNATTIPCFGREGQLIGIRVRNWQPEELEIGRKYVPLQLLDGTQYNFPTSETFYGLNYNATEIERTGTVILGEPEKMTLQLDTWYGEHNVALGMFGKNLNKRRRDILIKLGVRRVIYVADNDWIGKSEEFFDTWQKEIFAFAKQFDGLANVEIVWDNLGLLGAKENATDRTKDVWEELYKNRLLIP